MTKTKNKNTIAADAATNAEATAKVRTAASDAYAAALAERSGAELARDTARNDVASAKASPAELTATKDAVEAANLRVEYCAEALEIAVAADALTQAQHQALRLAEALGVELDTGAITRDIAAAITPAIREAVATIASRNAVVRDVTAFAKRAGLVEGHADPLSPVFVNAQGVPHLNGERVRLTDPNAVVAPAVQDAFVTACLEAGLRPAGAMLADVPPAGRQDMELDNPQSHILAAVVVSVLRHHLNGIPVELVPNGTAMATPTADMLPLVRVAHVRTLIVHGEARKGSVEVIAYHGNPDSERGELLAPLTSRHRQNTGGYDVRLEDAVGENAETLTADARLFRTMLGEVVSRPGPRPSWSGWRARPRPADPGLRR